MDVRIKKLNADLIGDFFELLEGNQFEHQKEWAGCYCRYYHTNVTDEEWFKRSPEQNKFDAKSEIETGQMNGYLAYDEDKPIGWLNVDSIVNYPRITKNINFNLVDTETALAMCFVIKQDYRGQGVASALLDHAIDRCRRKGFRRIIGLPFKTDVQEKSYRGFKDMFFNRGFIEIERHGLVSIMVLDL